MGIAMFRKTNLKFFITFILLICFAVSSSAAVGDNLMANAEIVESSGFVNDEEKDLFCMDENLDTKWCWSGSESSDSDISGRGAKNWLTVDFGEMKYFNRYQLYGASLCKRDYGVRDFDISSWVLEASDDLVTWREISAVSGYGEQTVDIEIPLTYARYIRLIIIDPTQGDDSDTVRISEFRVIESDETGALTLSDSKEVIARLEEAQIAAEAAKRQSLIGPAVLYWSVVAVAGILVSLLVFFVNRKKKKSV